VKGPWHRLSRVHRDILIFTSSAHKTWVLHVNTFYSWILYISLMATVNRSILSVLYITRLWRMGHKSVNPAFFLENWQSAESWNRWNNILLVYSTCFYSLPVKTSPISACSRIVHSWNTNGSIPNCRFPVFRIPNCRVQLADSQIANIWKIYVIASRIMLLIYEGKL
jgi:hypothetical protein